MSGWAGAQSLHAEGGRAIAYTGMCDCFVRTVRDEGVKALFKVGFRVWSFKCVGKLNKKLLSRAITM